MTDQLALIPVGAVVCPACGGMSPSVWHADLNHQIMHGTARCVSQWLALNHIAYTRRNGTPEQLAACIRRAQALRLTEKDWT